MEKKEYDKKYQREVMKQFRLALHPVHDKDILEYIESRRGLEISKQRFVKDIIREDMIFHEKINRELRKDMEKMKRKFTADSFGNNCPENWEEIIAYLNDKLEETEEDPEDIWERYCSDGYPDAPKAIISNNQQ